LLQHSSARLRVVAALLALAALVGVPALVVRGGRPSAQEQAAARPRTGTASLVPTTRDASPSDLGFTGYAFDACHAPTQQQMDAWLARSPYRGIGIYIAGANRYCPTQKNLDRAWVAEQTRKGWYLLPLTVGRQAACTHVPQWQKVSPAPADSYAAARMQGGTEAVATAAAARRLGIGTGTTMWLDVEAYDIANPGCRASTLAFVSGWTNTLHLLGYRSGFYSNGNSGIRSLEDARLAGPGDDALPDQVWVADWNFRDGDLSRQVSAAGWTPHRLVHQYVGDHAETYGGVRLVIDSDFVDLGVARPGRHLPHCGLPRDYGRYRSLRAGDHDTQVAVLQCFLGGGNAGRVTGHYDAATVAAVRRFQQQHHQPVTGAVGRRTWMTLLARGSTPVLRYGADADAVRRVQRALNAATGAGLPVDGFYGRATEEVVRRYQHRQGLRHPGVVTRATWRRLQAGLG
jgi:peptidoglycan hydrolase-like protein with peptidoglycan-binding domain